MADKGDKKNLDGQEYEAVRVDSGNNYESVEWEPVES